MFFSWFPQSFVHHETLQIPHWRGICVQLHPIQTMGGHPIRISQASPFVRWSELTSLRYDRSCIHLRQPSLLYQNVNGYHLCRASLTSIYDLKCTWLNITIAIYKLLLGRGGDYAPPIGVNLILVLAVPPSNTHVHVRDRRQVCPPFDPATKQGGFQVSPLLIPVLPSNPRNQILWENSNDLKTLAC